jgi:hypothetical protein
MPEIVEGYRKLVLVLPLPGLYCLMVPAEWPLKRRHGVRLKLRTDRLARP